MSLCSITVQLNKQHHIARENHVIEQTVLNNQGENYVIEQAVVILQPLLSNRVKKKIIRTMLQNLNTEVASMVLRWGSVQHCALLKKLPWPLKKQLSLTKEVGGVAPPELLCSSATAGALPWVRIYAVTSFNADAADEDPFRDCAAVPWRT